MSVIACAQEKSSIKQITICSLKTGNAELCAELPSADLLPSLWFVSVSIELDNLFLGLMVKVFGNHIEMNYPPTCGNN